MHIYSSLLQLPAQQRLPEENPTLLHSLPVCLHEPPPPNMSFFIKKQTKTAFRNGPCFRMQPHDRTLQVCRVILDQENQRSLRMRQLPASKDSATAIGNTACAEFSTAALQRLQDDVQSVRARLAGTRFGFFCFCSCLQPTADMCKVSVSCQAPTFSSHLQTGVCVCFS